MRIYSLLALVVCLGLVAAAGCGGRSGELEEHNENLEATRVVFDLVDRAASAEVLHDSPFVDIGAHDSLSALEVGWGDPELSSDSRSTFAWAIADRAVVKTTVFETDLRQLGFRCRPFNWEGAPEQRIAVAVNGQEIDNIGLEPGFKDYFVELPAGTVKVGTNSIEFRFSRTAAPADRQPGKTDRRTLAAAFDWVGFGSPETGNIVAFEESAEPVADGREVVIPSGTGLRYRLTVPEDAVLEFGLATAPPETANLNGLVWVAKPGEPATAVVETGPAVVAGKRVSFDIRAGGMIDLVLATSRGEADGGALVFRAPKVLANDETSEDVASILLIVVDTLRADYLGVYGGEVDTPTVDGLAAKGVLFANARSHIPITGPSHASLFTGLLPMENGVLNNAQELSPRFPILAESLRSADRHTAAVISLGVLQRDFGFGRGFDSYGDGFPRDWLKDAVEVTDEALEVAETSFDGPFFFWVHYSDPHEPYAPLDAEYPKFDIRLAGESIGTIDARGRGFWFDIEIPPGESDFEVVPFAPDPDRVFRLDNLEFDNESIAYEPRQGWRVLDLRMGRSTLEASFPATIRLSNSSSEPIETRLLISCKELLSKPMIRKAYAREVEIVDREIGRLLTGLERLGLMNDTLVVFASDHGEGLGNHNHVGHISQLYDSLLQVPLIFTWPGRLNEGLVVDDPVGLIDVYPTIADLLGIEGPAASSGASLAPLMRGEEVAQNAIIAATYRPESSTDKRALVLEGLKYIHSWRDGKEKEELFDVVHDPGELEDLAASRPEDLDRLRNELAMRLAEMVESDTIEAELSDEEKAHLRALGYIH